MPQESPWEYDPPVSSGQTALRANPWEADPVAQPASRDPRDMIPTDEPGTGGFVTREQADRDAQVLRDRAETRRERGQRVRSDAYSALRDPGQYLASGAANVWNNLTSQPLSELNPARAFAEEMPAAQLGMQGATLGFGDEIMGGVTAAGAAVSGGNAGDTYRRNTDAAREELHANREAAPLTSIALEGAGGAVLPMGAASNFISRGTSTGARLGRSAVVGGATGAVVGTGEAEGGAGNRALGGAVGGTIGALLGPATAMAAGLAGRGASAVRNAIAGPTGEARDAVGDAAVRFARRSGVADDLRNNPDAVSGDGFLAERLGANSRETAVGLSGAGGTAQDVAQDAIATRQSGRADRVSGAAARATEMQDGARPVDALMQIDEVRSAARPLFNSSDEVMGRMTPRMREMLRQADRAGVSFGNADELAARYGDARVQLSSFTGDFDGLPAEVRIGDVRAMARAIEARARVLTRQGDDPGELWNLAREMRDNIAKQSPDYREAARMWRSAARDDEAFDLGAAIFAPGARAEQGLRRFVTSGTSQTERRTFLAGIADAIERRMGAASSSGNAAAPLNRNLIRARLQRFLGDDAADELMATIDREMGQSRFEAVANREINSATEPRMAGRDRVRRARAGGLRNAAAEVISDPMEFLRGREGRRRLAEVITAGNDDALAEVARVLYSEGDLSSDPLVRRILAAAERRGLLVGGSGRAITAGTGTGVRAVSGGN